MSEQDEWTNPSARILARAGDPIDVITKKARAIILSFVEAGGEGPPFDPFAIAEFLNIRTMPSVDVRDARTVYLGGRLCVEFNPNRPRSRVRYSLSHELVHTLFPDCKEEVRYRAEHQGIRSDGWQLEMLCNIGAAELLMPIGSFRELASQELSIDNLLAMRSTYDVSTEALLLRFIKLTQRQCAMFSASRIASDLDRYRIDYAKPSSSWGGPRTSRGLTLPRESVVNDCTAIGFTSKGIEAWLPTSELFEVECVGIPPYPNQTYPRVLGIISPVEQTASRSLRPAVIKGDATQPRGSGERIVAFVVNDRARRWGAGFGLAVRKKWSHVQADFIDWIQDYPGDFELGNIHSTQIESNLTAVELICQHGYGDSPKPRIRYKALAECLNKLATLAAKRKASVHMPRIGSGQAGGHWPIILELIDDSLSKRGIDVTIYELPNAHTKVEPQSFLDFSGQTQV